MALKSPSRERAATARSRAERTRQPPSAPPPPEIVPGRLSQSEWLSLLAAEQAENEAADVLAELLEGAMAACYELYLERQRVPFTVQEAREAMLHIAAWRFLARDEGERCLHGDATWQEDAEPEPCVTDSWAQGCVSVSPEPPSPSAHEVRSTRALPARPEPGAACACSSGHGPSEATSPGSSSATEPAQRTAPAPSFLRCHRAAPALGGT